MGYNDIGGFTGLSPATVIKAREAEAAKKKAATIADLQAQIKAQEAGRVAEVQRGPGYEAVTQTAAERKAGIMPPGYEGTRDVRTGELLDKYKIDPFAGEASQRLRTEALGSGPSEWAKNALGQQRFEEAGARGNAGLQQQQAQSAAMANLSRMGGLGGGARTSLARSGARDALMAQQAVAQQGQQARFGVADTDAKRRQELLGTSADAERQAQVANIGTSTTDIRNRGLFNVNRYNEQMKAWASKQSADATRASGGGKK